MKSSGFLIFLTTLLVLSGCKSAEGLSQPSDTASKISIPSPEEKPTSTETTKEVVEIRFAALPLIDTLPIYVAEEEGLFSKNGLILEFIPVASAPERDQVLVADQADATVNEILSDMFMNKEEVMMQVVRYAQVASPSAAHFYILVSAQSGIDTVEELKGIEIGISQGTIIEYVTDRLLQAQGFKPEEINTVAVPKMPDRVALLASGELKAGVLPDPLAALSVQQGSRIILDDRLSPSFGASVISFTKEFVNQHPEAVRLFLAVVEEAVGLINADPSKYADILSEKQLVPPPLIGNFSIPQFPTSGITSEAEWNDALAWAQEKGLISVDVSYTNSVNASFLP